MSKSNVIKNFSTQHYVEKVLINMTQICVSELTCVSCCSTNDFLSDSDISNTFVSHIDKVITSVCIFCQF